MTLEHAHIMMLEHLLVQKLCTTHEKSFLVGGGIERPTVGYKKCGEWLKYAAACVVHRRRSERLALQQQALAQRVRDLKR